RDRLSSEKQIMDFSGSCIHCPAVFAPGNHRSFGMFVGLGSFRNSLSHCPQETTSAKRLTRSQKRQQTKAGALAEALSGGVISNEFGGAVQRLRSGSPLSLQVCVEMVGRWHRSHGHWLVWFGCRRQRSQ